MNLKDAILSSISELYSDIKREILKPLTTTELGLLLFVLTALLVLFSYEDFMSEW